MVLAGLLFSPQLALAQLTQQWPKLVGAGAVGNSEQGQSVALSGDGNTAIVGGPTDNSDAGAAWVYTRSGGIWIQQGSKLVGAGAVGNAAQGISVALSADGNTAIVGGYGDNSLNGAAWVFTRSGGVWTQQGKLVGTGGTGGERQGFSVTLSGDGNTAMVGGPGDNGDFGAVWVFARSRSGVWKQHGSKLLGTGVVDPSSTHPYAKQGTSVALSSDGNTAIVGGPYDSSGGAVWVYVRHTSGSWTQQGSKLGGIGGSSVGLSGDGNTALVGSPGDNSSTGAAWVYTRSGSVWTQGSKLVGTGAVDGPQQGLSVALSSDGNTALVGGPYDFFRPGAWAFARSGGVWNQLGSEMIGTCVTGPAFQAYQGRSVALSGDGNTAILGGFGDNAYIGAAWVFARTANTVRTRTNAHDYNGDGCSDIAWRDTAGNTALWLISNAQVESIRNLGAIPPTWSIVGQRDFNGDGMSDILWRDASGNTVIWFLNPNSGALISSTAGLGNIPTSWTVVATADFDGDGNGDILWQDASGNLAMWLMNGGKISSSAGVGNVPSTWSIVATADFDGDGKADLLWRDTGGNLAIWFMNGAQTSSAAGLGNVPVAWSVVATGDFNGDGKFDLLWRDTGGNTAMWFMNGAAVSSSGGIGNVPTAWSVVATGDYDGDGKSDLLWRDTSGNTAIWFMNGASVRSTANLGNIPTTWTVQNANAE